MIFWQRLRWTATVAFLALIALSWVGRERTGPSQANVDRPFRMAPNFYR
jgi:hypothetical protein